MTSRRLLAAAESADSAPFRSGDNDLDWPPRTPCSPVTTGVFACRSFPGYKGCTFARIRASQRDCNRRSAMSDESEKSSTFEMLCGLTLAVLAAVLAINELGAGKYGDDEIIAHNQKANAFDWYQAKGIKQSLVEGQRDILRILLESRVIPAESESRMGSLMATLDKEIGRYRKERKEILLGSAAVGQENWVLEEDGKLGQVKGAREWEAEAKALGAVGDTFDIATFFLQICLVMGAISLILKGERMRNTFYGLMVLLGAVGTVYCIMAYLQAGAFA